MLGQQGQNISEKFERSNCDKRGKGIEIMWKFALIRSWIAKVGRLKGTFMELEQQIDTYQTIKLALD